MADGNAHIHKVIYSTVMILMVVRSNELIDIRDARFLHHDENPRSVSILAAVDEKRI